MFCVVVGSTALVAQDIDSLLDQFVDDSKIVGLIVALIDDDEVEFYHRGTLSEGGPEVNENTIFEIGSITKTFTGLLLAELVLEGKVKFSDPIDMYLPKYIQVPEYQGKKITLGYLVTHTSGLPHDPDNLSDNKVNPYCGYTRGLFFDFLERYQLDVEPGTKFEYSNVGMGLLGILLEQEQGMSFEVLVKERITAPLGMTSTSITGSESCRLSMGYYCNEEGRLIAVPPFELSLLASAGSLRSTAKDLSKYLKAYMGIGLVPPLLQEAAQKAIHPYFITSDEKVGAGLGWKIDLETGLIGHEGTTVGFMSTVAFDPKQRKGVVLLSNTVCGDKTVREDLISAIFSNWDHLKED